MQTDDRAVRSKGSITRQDRSKGTFNLAATYFSSSSPPPPPPIQQMRFIVLDSLRNGTGGRAVDGFLRREFHSAKLGARASYMAEEAGEGERRGVRGGAPNMPKKALGGCVGTASPRGTVRELLCKRLRRECRTIDKHQHGGGGGERQIERQLIRFLEGKSALPAAAGQAGWANGGGAATCMRSGFARAVSRAVQIAHPEFRIRGHFYCHKIECWAAHVLGQFLGAVSNAMPPYFNFLRGEIELIRD